MLLQDKKILLGITGSIAAYKSIILTRLLIKEGAEVRIIMTPAAADFVSPLVLSTLSKNKVMIDIASADVWENHVLLGRWADVFLIAPASCNTIAKMATGLCDNLLLTTYLSTVCPVIIAPAMDEDMWLHPSTKKNLATLESYGNKIITVTSGELASGLTGEGRMEEPEHIITYLQETLFRKTILKGKKILVTAGPTYEPIDPVRFIGNHSSGKMGYALAKEAYLNGADVTLISGNSSETIAYKGIELIKVDTAEEMYLACKDQFANSDIVVMNAAVADYKPITVSDKKIKKSDESMTIELTKTIDILKYIGEHKKETQFVMGFALETNDEEKNAFQKLRNKHIDCIVLNSLQTNGAGFKTDTNAVTIINKDETLIQFTLQSKTDIARHIISYIIKHINEK